MEQCTPKIVNNKSRGQRFKEYISKNRQLIIMVVPGVIMLILFKLAPLLGMIIAFQDYSPFSGILGSPFSGLKYFERMLHDPYMPKLVVNTVVLAFETLIFSFPVPIIFSLLVNEIRLKSIKDSVQSFSFLPYFISSAVMVSIVYTMLSPSSGIVNEIIKFFGGKPISFMSNPHWFRPIYIILQIWQTFGYSSIIYMASMASIDMSVYESADIDGAGRWKKMWYITLPAIKPTIITMLIISVGNIFTVDLDRILLMYNQSVYETADVLQTYVYRLGFASSGFPEYSYGTAVNLVKSVIAFLLVTLTNKIADKYADSRLF